LSASPTPGNDPRHSNVAQGVRETYNEPAVCCARAEVSSAAFLRFGAAQNFHKRRRQLATQVGKGPSLQVWVAVEVPVSADLGALLVVAV